MILQNIFDLKIIVSIELRKIFKSHLVEMIIAGFCFLMLIRRGTNWTNFINNSLLFLSAVIGSVGFGILASWVFSREFTDGIFKDLLALPISRSNFVLGKLIAIEIAELFIVSISLLLILITGHFIFSSAPTMESLKMLLSKTEVTFVYNVLLAFLWPLLASFFRSALFPMSLAFISLIIDVMFSSQPAGQYIPWAIPGFYLAHAGMNLFTSKIIICLIGSIGIYGTIFLWKHPKRV
ncbi:ABC transporter permease [Liquorilactobacillus mali]|uniref:ABC transporter permease n=1 Tax=Liquorilactobacillus mali KCTC 3596 = DSM 20444 TaxID=1046596 RepID=J0UP86_9LACO|nr:ABC transporter permease [Liquorilactobacillus mali]EJE97312.1 hypothetical protein LMA_10335 [Liquorilactobacillus mali KCTC 3596 = DSM 20444]KRN11360.1 hypothetical protein FD00_GL000765 [Liquorilactobacillus mali KCTC 3596 = DSM 20444]MDC7953135.1 ABC transporter permease [Liquorilactobacillus mali]MDV7757272.1 ABC transporter permease [Liquorilactobacillus mali]QFQ75306.1 ABC transporter permease [Liquorilactobacillus mali]